MSRPFCRRCLLEDMPDRAALARSVRELIALLPDTLRAPEEIRRARLDVCRGCDHLTDGMCTLCGCYVELRAAKARLSCPDVPGRWKACGTQEEDG